MRRTVTFALLFAVGTGATAPTAAPSFNSTGYWYTTSYVGAPCEPGGERCPPFQSCYSPSAIAAAGYEGYDDDIDDATGQHRCGCWSFYGFVGDENPSGRCEGSGSVTNRIAIAVFAIAAMFSVGTSVFFCYTVGALCLRWQSKKLKINAAIATLLMGAAASLPLTFTTVGYCVTALELDPELSFENAGQKGVAIGVLALIGLPCLFNVVNLWIDVALSAMNKGGTKKQRAATKKKVNCVIYTVTGITSVTVCGLLLMEMTAVVLAVMVFMAMLMGCSYGYGGHLLSKALSKGKEVHGGDGGAKKSCCSAAYNKEDMNVWMVLKTANGISYSMFAAFIAAVAFLMAPSIPASPKVPPSPVPVVAIAVLLSMFGYSFLCVLCYIRYGLRKVLDIDFPDAPKTNRNGAFRFRSMSSIATKDDVSTKDDDKLSEAESEAEKGRAASAKSVKVAPAPAVGS